MSAQRKHIIFSVLTVLGLLSCATPRTRLTDKNMRIMVDPRSILKEHYVRIVKALVESNKWDVIDRRDGFEAVMTEQNLQHRLKSDRFEDKEKWSHWAKLYGVGAIVVANAQCETRQTFLFGRYYQFCQQFLTLVDANTAQVITAIDAEAEGPTGQRLSSVIDTVSGIAPPWDEAVQKLNDAYPAYFQSAEYHERVKKYQQESRKLAEEQKKIMSEEQKAQ